MLAGWQPSQRITTRAFLAYSHFLADSVNHEQSFRLGDTLTVGTDMRYERRPIAVTVNVQATIQEKNEVPVRGELRKEISSTNGTDLFVLCDFTYAVSQRLTLRLLGDIRYYGKSALKDAETGLPFKGQHIRYAAGPGFLYALNEHLSLNGLLKVHQMRQEPGIPSPQAVTFQGLNLDISMTYRF